MKPKVSRQIWIAPVLRILTLVLLSSATICAQDQSQYDHGTPPQHAAGPSAIGSYVSSDLGTVNLSNGSLNFKLPLGTVGGRGFSIPLTLNYSNKVWSATRSTAFDPDAPGGGRNYPVAFALYDDPNAALDIYQRVAPGWSIGSVPVLRVRGVGIQSVHNPNGCTDYIKVLVKLTLMLPDKGEIELRDDVTDGSPLGALTDQWGCRDMDGYRGQRWHATDGSGAVFISDVDNAVINGDLNGTVITGDGTRYRIQDPGNYFFGGSAYLQKFGRAISVTDRNGNVLNINYPGGSAVQYTDQLGRTTTRIDYGVNDPDPPYQPLAVLVTLPGYNGQNHYYKIKTGEMNQHYRAGINPTLPVINGDNDPLGYGYGYPGPHTSLFPLSYGSSRENIDTQAVLTQLVLPDGRLLTFNYNEYGEVAEVVMPTGGKVQYDYAYASALPAGNSAGWETRTVQIPSDVHEIDRAVVARRTYADGSTLESSWSYAYGPQTAPNGTYGCTEVQAHAADNTLVQDQRHFFMTSGRFLTWNGTEAIGTGYSLWSTGLELRGETRDAANTVLGASEEDWTQRAPVAWTYYSSQQIANDNRVNEGRKILDDGSTSKVDTYYQANVKYNNPTEIQDYDYDQSLKRRSTTTYADSSNLINGLDYTSDSIHLLNLPLVQTVYEGNGNQAAQTVSEYDNYTDDTNHAPLQDYGSVTQHDSNYGLSYITRGNLTRIGRWLNLTNSSIYSYPRYDDLGNVISAKDPNGNIASISFADDFGNGSNPGAGASGAFGATYALPTLITSPPPNPGEPVQTARSQYDFSTGLLTGFKDRNNVVSQTIYKDPSTNITDPFDRPRLIKVALNTSAESHTAVYYAQSTPITILGITLTNNDVLTAKDQNSIDDKTLYSWIRTDGFGRTVQSWSRDPQGDDEVATIYDALGRVSKQSNPFRPSLSETPVFSMPAYDLMGRVTTVTTPDNAVVTTAYSSNTVTVTDQSGKQRKSVSDALGRLAQVYEAPNDPSYSYLTSYNHDSLDNLITVNQGNQIRSFAYDSLKRLTSAMNPESGTVTYDYDNNGNLRHRTDARSITTTLAYDALNRLTTRSYQNDPNGTPPVNYFYDSQTPPPGAPTFSSGYATGRLVAVTYGSGNSAGDYYGFDALGRQTLKIQQIGGVNYKTSAIYNLAGGLITETYPSNRTVTNTYDSAGRTNSVTGYLGDGTQRTYSTGIIYDAASRMAKEQFGTATPVFNKLFYNIRGQLSEIRESTSYTGPTDTTWDRGAIINNYSLQAGCVGASCSATDNNGNLMRQDIYIPGSPVFSQFYGYDSLNRLQSVREDGPPGPANWQQSYAYDQYGNRKVNSAATWGNGINNMQAAVDPNTTTNKMYAPGETDQNHSLIDYDSAGNQKKDYYSYSANGVVYDRTYDAENRMKSSTTTYSSPASTQTSTYTYDGGGRRVKRNIGGTETWQVYGLGGELLGEYAPNASPLTPQKEYGYRNGQMLITATAPSGLAANTASDTNTNAVAAASPASGTGSRMTAQSFDLLASIKGLVLRLPGISTDTSASTEAVSDTSTPLFGPSFPYASLNRSALPLMPQSGSAKIAFASNRDGSAQIYSMNTDGSGLSRLTNDAANDEAPNWSPNNSRIVFQSDRDNLFSGIADIYVMNWDGTGQTRLTSNPADDSAPVWSPDGTKIAFQSARNGVNYQVYVMNADGSGQVNISNSTANDNQPSWSSDGSKIAFASDRDQAGFSSIYVMNANGTNQMRLTTGGAGVLDQQPAWSPDGTKLTFTSTRDSITVTWTETDDNGGTVTKSKLNVNKEVYVMNANGSAQVRLTNTLENDDSASWSGDGTKIVFRSDRERPCCDPTEQVWVMNPDGTSQVDLSNNGLAEHCPSWQHVVANMPPAVSLTSPTSGAIFTAPANITITANASDSDGSISRVDFYQGVTLIGTATASPYTVSWNSVAAGTYSLTARATDNLGAQTNSSAVSITVNAPPTVSITTPTQGATFTAPANITITANASDSDGSISRVDFYQGTTLIGTATTSPYTIAWNNVAAGGYTLTAKATDNLGASTTSNPVNVTVGSPPTVSVTTPASGANFTAPANVTLTANASSSTGSISRVEFYQSTTLIGTASTSPYTISWNNVAAGSYTLKARAIDNSGASTDSTPVNISVNAPPAVSITSPTNGASFNAPANIAITANASDTDGTVSRVDFYQGTTLIGTATASPYNVNWNNVTTGSYSLTAKATDNLGAQTTSTAINITVITPVADIRWIVTDQLGTPRMIFDQTGNLANLSRHDYLPFGEELGVNVGGRTTAQGYGQVDGIRQQFTGQQRDNETGLDYFNARYYASMQGRFTSADPLGGKILNPQTLNKYAYVRNNPLRLTDPTGMYVCSDSTDKEKCSSKQDKGFEKARQRDLKSNDADVVRAAKAYGDPNKDNHVTVSFADLDKKGEGGVTTSTLGADDQGKLYAKSDVVINSNLSGSALDAAVGHEGSHVSDAQDVVSSIVITDMEKGTYKVGQDITRYQSEQRAYRVTDSILRAGNESYHFGCGVLGDCILGTELKMRAQVPETIDRLLANSLLYKDNGKPLSSKNQGGSVVNGLVVPH